MSNKTPSRIAASALCNLAQFAWRYKVLVREARMLSNYERGDLMARSVYPWGFTTEAEEAFAERIAKIADTEGIQAAAKSVSDQANGAGLRMTPERVLKSLIHAEGQLRRHEPKEIPGAPPPLPPRTGPRMDYAPPRDYVSNKSAAEERGCWMQMIAALVVIPAVIAAIWYFAF
jgi:hypothetical protein